jgi:hypothetical protein
MVAKKERIQARSVQIVGEAVELYWRGWGSSAALCLRLLPSERHREQTRHHQPPGAARAPPWPSPQGHSAILHRGKPRKTTISTPTPKPSYSSAHPWPSPAG